MIDAINVSTFHGFNHMYPSTNVATNDLYLIFKVGDTAWQLAPPLEKHHLLAVSQ